MVVAIDILLPVPLFSMHPLSVLPIQAISNFGAGIVAIDTQSAMLQQFGVLTSSVHAPNQNPYSNTSTVFDR